MLEEWKAFDELDPDLQPRIDWGFAHVVQAIMRDGRPLRDYMMPIGDYPMPPATVVVPQTVEYQEMLIDAWIMASNAALKKR